MFTKIKQLYQQENVWRYLTNTSWFMGEKFLRLFAGLFVGIWVARYLGPEQFGMLSYAMAFTALFSPLGKLGLDGIVSRDIARNESDIDELISSSVAIKFLGSILGFSLVTSYMYFFKDEKVYVYLGVILSFVFVLRAFEVIEFYFRAKVKAKYIAISNSLGIVFSALIKLLFILGGFSIVYFAIANAIEVVVAISLLSVFFLKQPNKISIGKIKYVKAFELIKESWPLILGGFFALIYLNIDQVMIEEMLGSFYTGQYGAAVRVSSMWYFVPMTIGWSVQAAVVNAKKRGNVIYFERLQLLFTLLALLAYVFILPISVFSNDIIGLLFGDDYLMAGNVLALHVFASLFVFVGSVRGLWVTNESHFKFALLSNVGAGLLNVVMNYFWIPRFGILGAAWATLVAYFFANIGSGMLFSPAFGIVKMQFRSIFMVDLYSQIKKIKS